MAANAYYDLTTVAAVKRHLSIDGFADDASIQGCINAASSYWLWRCGYRPAITRIITTGSPPVPLYGDTLFGAPIPDVTYYMTSPLVLPIVYDEWYDGPGGVRMFLKQRPIVSVSEFEIGGVLQTGSTTPVNSGWVIDQDQKSIALRGGLRIPMGIQNVRVKYIAGYDSLPADVEEKCRIMVALNYKRRNWIDQSSQALAAGSGTVSYRNWELPPDVVSVMISYSRNAVC